MFKLFGITLASVCVGLALTGCGEHEGFITTRTAVAALRDAGFSNLRVLSNRKAYQEYVRKHPDLVEFARKHPGTPLGKVGKQALDVDTIYLARTPRWPPTRTARGFTFGPLLAVRLPSVAYAKKTYKQGYSPEALRGQVAEARRNYPEVLPRGFAFSRLRTARVCNVVVSSYNDTGDRSLDSRLDRALALLEDKC
jgi:hypothetical protein